MKASINFNSNRAISCSESNWSFVREGSFVKFGNDEVCYVVSSTKKFTYQFEATSPNKSTLKPKEKLENQLLPDDTLKITIPEYSLFIILGLVNEGKRYRLQDQISPVGGIPFIDTFTGKPRKTILEVNNVGENGEIKGLKLVDEGRYILPPGEVIRTEGGHGIGAELKIQFTQKPNAITYERIIKNIVPVSDIILLDAPLPDGINDCTASVEKWELFLNSNYAGKNKFGVDCQFSRDATPYLRIPLMLPNSMTTSAIYNLGVKTIDAKFQELQSQISELKSKLGV